MKGLLLKDLYMIKKYCHMLILMIVIFIFISTVNDGAVFTVYPVVMAGLIPVTLIAYEERAKWDVYSNILPVTKFQTVLEKYIISAGSILATVIISCGAHCVRMTAGTGFSIGGLFSFAVVLISASLIGPAFVLPFVFAFGMEKGRIAYYISIGVICAVAVGISTVGVPQIPMSPAVLFVIDIVILAASLSVSVKLYKRREIS